MESERFFKNSDLVLSRFLGLARDFSRNFSSRLRFCTFAVFFCRKFDVDYFMFRAISKIMLSFLEKLEKLLFRRTVGWGGLDFINKFQRKNILELFCTTNVRPSVSVCLEIQLKQFCVGLKCIEVSWSRSRVLDLLFYNFQRPHFCWGSFRRPSPTFYPTY